MFQRLLLLFGFCALMALAVALSTWLAGDGPQPATATGANSIVPVDPGNAQVGQYTSLRRDGAGNPVVSYYDVTNGDLKVLHCNDANCTGGDESITSPDTGGNVGQFTSLALDTSGFPVVSYYGVTNGDLKVLHCNDANCTGGDESITSPDTGGTVGQFTSLALDTSGFPVVSYYDVTNGDLKVLHCNDANCTGGDESITSPDTGGNVGQFTSLALDTSGFPVVSYYDVTNLDLKVLHCNDANCTGGDESITSPDTGGDVGARTSLRLDGAGSPVVSYFDNTNGDLKVLHCNDANCAGGDESITSPDTGGIVGTRTSLALDGSGYPVVSYRDVTNEDLKVLHCNDVNCTGGDESIVSPDTAGVVGLFTSIALDGSGYPVVGYFDDTNGELKVLHCNDANCTGGDESITSPDIGTGAGTVGGDTSIARDGSGFPVVSYYDYGKVDLKVLHCGNANCTAGNSIVAVDRTGFVGLYTSLRLDSSGYPVVSYYDTGTFDLKVLHCNDANCAGGDESITSPDTGGSVGRFTSLALDSTGYPVVSYSDQTNGDLKVLHCNDVNCTGGDESITSPDTGGSVGEFTSLALDGSGYPAVSYMDVTTFDLKVLHCNDANCTGGDESITSPDTAGTVGGFTSLRLDGSGFPVVSYYDYTNGDLKLLHCNDTNCAGGDESISAPDSAGTVGGYTSLRLDVSGYPVVSYANGGVAPVDLKLLHCNDVNCTGGDESIISPDTVGDVGRASSLVLDSSGYPIVSYGDTTNADLKLLHCSNADCSGKGPPTPTPTVTPTPTPTKQASPGDTDLDGCSDVRENLTNPIMGGLRNYKNHWDFFDTDADKDVDIDDVGAVASRFLRTAVDMPPGVPPYLAAADRGASVGMYLWNKAGPDGSIDIDDVASVAAQFLHSC